MVFDNFTRFISLLIFQQLLICNYCSSATQLTYDGCKSDTTNSYIVGGWCFYLYYNSSWPTNTPVQDVAQSICGPNGTLAVGVTYKMINTFVNKLAPSIHYAWLALNRNMSSSSTQTGWYWNSLLPSGGYATAPVVMSNIPWGPAGCTLGSNCQEPNNAYPPENAAAAVKNWGVGDVQKTNPIGVYGAQTAAVICQFAPLQWNYLQRGQGRFAVSAYRIAQSTVVKPQCVLNCHTSALCVSFAFNPTTQDCQTYSVSPADPRFAGSVIADSTYLWFIRDEMEY